MNNKQFGILCGVGVVCITAILAIAGCVKHIVTTICNMNENDNV